jgi:hypothetical protein
MPEYKVSVIEEWIHYGVVEADNTEEALALVDADSPKIAWTSEINYLHVKEESSLVYDPEGGTWGF